MIEIKYKTKDRIKEINAIQIKIRKGRIEKKKKTNDRKRITNYRKKETNDRNKDVNVRQKEENVFQFFFLSQNRTKEMIVYSDREKRRNKKHAEIAKKKSDKKKEKENDVEKYGMADVEIFEIKWK